MSEGLPVYETVFITKTETSDPLLAALKERVNKAIEAAKGEVRFTDDWGKRKMAYPIKKHPRGHYHYLLYTGEGDLVGEVERNLRLSEHTLRYLSVNLGDSQKFDQTEYLKKYQICVRPPKLEEKRGPMGKPRRFGSRDRDME